MYKVYRGGGGEPRRVEDRRPQPPPPPPPGAPFSPRPSEGFAEPVRQAIESLLGRMTGELETEDLLLLLILYLLYRESGDTQMLLVMGAMLLL